MKEIKKLVASDLDATIVNRENQISDNNKQLIQKFMQETNNAFTIVTGRNYFIAFQHARNLNVTLPIITTNGVSVIDPNTNEYIAKHHFSKVEAHALMDRLYENNVLFHLLNDFEVYLVKEHPSSHFLLNKDIDYMELTDNLFNQYATFDDLYHDVKENAQNFCGFYIYCDDHLHKEYVVKLLEDFDLEILEFGYDNRITLEVYRKGAGKDWGLNALAQYLNLNDDDLHLFGDEFNDYPMFKKYNNCYAVGNAIEGIKKLAKEVILPFDQDAVGLKIQELVADFK
ncbi:HAD-IIB family hydrolase [Spiroplasma culicicola]|uniref:HAD family hydrolase n=1 Tax=Spiroplasma culicicola AES-1 TaxID=1276246 RepID=W6A7L1_9MOLU|nr:HAD-IIB family hydrolase [Spiroplasma culicicola]AHI52972.1 HAD family hydrolase [Spiroplasma culicicola AES-1]